MLKLTYSKFLTVLSLPLALTAVGCSEEDPITAENVTLEQCEELFSDGAESAEDADGAGGAGAVEGDYDGDDDADEDDKAIEERCEELMSEDESADAE